MKFFGNLEEPKPVESPVVNRTGSLKTFSNIGQEPESVPKESSVLEEAKNIATEVVKAPVELVKYFVAPESPEAGKSITPQELEELSKKYKGKISPEELGNFAISMGGTLEKSEHPVIEKVIGIGLEGIGAGLAPFAAKKILYSDNPEAKQAVDELRQIVDERKTKGQVAAELASGLLVPGGIATKGASKATRVIAPVAAGAAFEVARSPEGKEARALVKGGLLGGYLHALGVGAEKGIKGAKKAVSKVKEDPAISAITFTPEKSSEIESAIQEKVSQRKVLDPYIDSIIDTGSALLTAEDAVKLIEERPSIASELLSNELREIEGIPKTEILNKKIAQKILSNELGEFARYLEKSEALGGKKFERTENALNQIKDVVATEGKEFIKDAYSRFKEAKAAQSVFDEGIISKLPESRKNVKNIRDYFLNSRYPYRFIDRKLGTSLEFSLDQLTENMNKYSLKVDNVLDKVADIGKSLEAVDINPNEVPYLIESGTWKSLEGPKKEAVKGIIDFQESLRKQAEELGLPIKAKDSYVRHSTVSAPEYMGKILDRVEELGIDLDGISQDKFKQIEASPSGQELIKAINVGGEIAPKNAVEFNILLKQALDPQTVTEKINSFASTAQKRTGEIPDFVRETNILKLLKNWGENTFRHAYFRKPLAEMKKARNRAISAGDKYSADYISSHIGQLLGTKAGSSNLAGWTKKQRIKFQTNMLREADKREGTRVGTAYKQLAQSPELVQFMMSQVYPNFLGLKAKSALVNLVQPLMLTVPEIGWTKGSGELFKAYTDLATTKMLGKTIKLSPEMAIKLNKKPGELYKTRDLRLILENEGNLPTKSFNHEVQKYISDGITQTTKGLPRRTVEKLNELAMFFFESSETINRYAVKVMGEQLAKEAFVNGKSKTLDKILPPAYKKELKGKTLEEAKQIISNYLINKTMFAYNKAELSRFGREFGSVMSQFSKFPSSISGDMIDIMQSRGVVKGSLETFRKYVAPTLALGAIGAVGLNGIMEESPAMKKLIGNQGLEDWGALSAIKSLADRGIAPPHIKNVIGVFQSAITASPQKGWKAFNDVVQSTLPLSWTLRFIGDDLPSLKGETPERGSFLQKALRGSGVDESSLDEYIQDLEAARTGR